VFRSTPEHVTCTYARWCFCIHQHLRPPLYYHVSIDQPPPSTQSRLCLKCDGTCAETRFCLSAKRTSPFKTAGASVQSTTGSRGVRISGSNVGYTMFRGSEGYWLPTPFASFPFTSPPVRHRVPSLFNWTLQHDSEEPPQLHLSWQHRTTFGDRRMRDAEDYFEKVTLHTTHVQQDCL
jgi:hypothetical protein